MGSIAMLENDDGNNNTGFGSGALSQNTTGIQNTCIGQATLVNSAGSGNTAIGYTASNQLLSGDNTISIGANTDMSSQTDNDQINIGDVITGSIASGSEAIILELPIGDPEVVGVLYNASGTLMVSAGPP
jgi:hypothetical protein